MKKSMFRNVVSTACNILTAVLVTYSIVCYFTVGGDANMQTTGVQCFKFFTNDSNILAALACLAILPYNVAAFRSSGQDLRLPRAVRILKFVGTVAVGVTLLTVVFFLAPQWGKHWPLLFAGNGLWLHLVCPLMCIGSFIFCEAEGALRRLSALWGVLPTALYGCVYLAEVVLIGEEQGGWNDFYGFNMGGFWFISFPVMLLATYLLSFAVLACRNLVCRRLGGKNEK